MNERYDRNDRRHNHHHEGKVNALAVVPARLLPYREQWQALANALPPGSILVCLPTAPTTRHQVAWDAMIQSMRAMGHSVLVLSMDRFLEGMRHG